MPSPLAARRARAEWSRFRTSYALSQPPRAVASTTKISTAGERKKAEANGPALRRSKTSSPRRCFRLIGRTVMRSPWCCRNKRVKHGLLQLKKRLLVDRRINGEWISREMTIRWRMKRLKFSQDSWLLIASWTYDFPFDEVLFDSLFFNLSI